HADADRHAAELLVETLDDPGVRRVLGLEIGVAMLILFAAVEPLLLAHALVANRDLAVVVVDAQARHPDHRRRWAGLLDDLVMHTGRGREREREDHEQRRRASTKLIEQDKQ